MQRVLSLILAAGLVLGSGLDAAAVDFTVKGEWDFFFNAGETSMYKKPHATRQTGQSADIFDPLSRIRLQIEAAASEHLSGTLLFELGQYSWGRAGSDDNPPGAALGERSVSARVKRAYLDWRAPGTELHFRMGLQGIELPNAAGGPAVLEEDEDVTAVAASFKINDHAGITAIWMRPYNDNFVRGDLGSRNAGGAFDNLDLGALALPLTFDGFSVTPWAMFGVMGKNALRALFAKELGGSSDFVKRGLFPVDISQDRAAISRFARAWSAMFWAGIPIKISAFEPFNFELDANYGYISGFGGYDDARAINADGNPRRNDSRREGFVLKALAEYKTDWGTPGVFGWYGSGDSGNTRNGSGRMPYLAPAGTFSSFGLGGQYGEPGSLQIAERADTGYSGTWAIGAQVSYLSFLDDLSHTVRIVYWRGANDPAMAAALRDPLSNGRSYANTAWNQQPGGALYLTTNDYLVEFNLDSTYKIYENFEACVELGYIINGVDKSTWKWSGNQKADAWKLALNLRYTF
ncbi:MAG: outer membrane homotrimeric porin [Deltaproteobacteria bacterium]|jgi:hypothetical protein|nr:outer membrane homotrimeric porin [Deltaproteobacteria bacterium]